MYVCTNGTRNNFDGKPTRRGARSRVSRSLKSRVAPDCGENSNWSLQTNLVLIHCDVRTRVALSMRLGEKNCNLTQGTRGGIRLTRVSKQISLEFFSSIFL